MKNQLVTCPFWGSPMDIFFDTLEKTNSREKAIDAVKAILLKRKLDIVDDGRSYEEAKAELEELLKLFEKERILSKIVARNKQQ